MSPDHVVVGEPLLSEYNVSANITQNSPLCPHADKKTFIWRWVDWFTWPDLRATALEEYPKIAYLPYFRFFKECCVPTQTEFATDNTMLPWQALSIIWYGDIRVCDTGQFLIDYMRDTDHCPQIFDYQRPREGKKGRVRTIGERYFSDRFRDRLQWSLDHPCELKDAVNFVTNTPYDKHTQKRLRAAAIEHAQSINRQLLRPQTPREISKACVDYLHALPVEFFRKAIKKYGAQAAERARQYSDKHENASKMSSRDYAVLHNGRLLPMAQPTYLAAKHSYRLYPDGVTLCNLPRELRMIYMQDCVTFDMASAQLAIIIKTWDIPEGEAYLRGEKKIWHELVDWIGLDYSSGVKHILKHTALYKIVFGGSVKNVMHDLDEALIDSDEENIERDMDVELGTGIGAKFVAHPLIAAIIKKRNAELTKIRKDGGATDCFGNWIPMLPSWNKEKERYEPNPRSVLAQLAQAMEFKLLYPVFELAIDHKMQNDRPEFEIVLYQFDGFTVRFHRSEKSWKKRIEEVFKAQADALGIITHLEEEEPYHGE